MLEHYVAVDGYRIRYLSGGDSGDSLVLLHGLGASAERWNPVVPFLKRHFRLIVPDIVGFGYSDKPAVDYTMDLFVDFVRKFFDAMGISNAHVMGSSLGGQISAEFVLDNGDRVKRLILVSPTGTANTMTATLNRYVTAAMYPNSDFVWDTFGSIGMIPKEDPYQFVDDFVRRMRLPNAKMAFLSTLLGLRDSSNIHNRLHRIRAPTMLVWGGMDTMIPEIHSKHFTSLIPDCVYMNMPESGHAPFTEHPKIFYGHVRKFFGI